MTEPRSRPFERYEDAALRVLADLATQLGIGRIDGPQTLRGFRTSTEWRVEGRAWRAHGGGFLIIECRRVRSGQKQEDVAALAYRVIDAGASGAILVTPVNPQFGARKVASASNITTVILDPNATAHDYVVRLLDAAFVRVTDGITITESWRIELRDEHGSVRDRREL